MPLVSHPTPSRICARCDDGVTRSLVISHDAIGRERLRCPHCDGVAKPRPAHPDDVRLPQGLVTAQMLPPLAHGQLRCQLCAKGVPFTARFCDECVPRTPSGYRFEPKLCLEPTCRRVFVPSGSRALYCEECA
jgi:hypothetical protein